MKPSIGSFRTATWTPIGSSCWKFLCFISWIMFAMMTGPLKIPVILYMLAGLFPVTLAASDQSPFPDIPFRLFSEFVKNSFSSQISLATVLTVLFTLTNNTDLLNLHARQQHPRSDKEAAQHVSGWMKALARAVEEKLGEDTDRLFQHSEQKHRMSNSQTATAIGVKLDDLFKLLRLHPFDEHGQPLRKLKPISSKNIEPIHIICPQSMQCVTQNCNGRSLFQETRDRDVPHVTLIKGTKIYDGTHVLSGRCPECDTRYYADHESSWATPEKNSRVRLYLPTANYFLLRLARTHVLIVYFLEQL